MLNYDDDNNVLILLMLLLLVIVSQLKCKYELIGCCCVAMQRSVQNEMINDSRLWLCNTPSILSRKLEHDWRTSHTHSFIKLNWIYRINDCNCLLSATKLSTWKMNWKLLFSVCFTSLSIVCAVSNLCCADGIEVIVNNNNNRMQELTIIYNVYFFYIIFNSSHICVCKYLDDKR